MTVEQNAFPIWTEDMPVVGGPGLTKRELFAAIALQGILANPGRIGPMPQAVKAAVECAEELLEELNR